MRTHTAAVAAVAAAATAAVLACLPGQQRAVLHANSHLHLLVHLILFGGIAYLSARSTNQPGTRALLCGAVALLGVLTECMEHALYGSAMEWTDMVLDAMGAVAGTSLGALLAPRSGSNWQPRQLRSDAGEGAPR